MSMGKCLDFSLIYYLSKHCPNGFMSQSLVSNLLQCNMMFIFINDGPFRGKKTIKQGMHHMVSSGFQKTKMAAKTTARLQTWVTSLWVDPWIKPAHHSSTDLHTQATVERNGSKSQCRSWSISAKVLTQLKQLLHFESHHPRFPAEPHITLLNAWHCMLLIIREHNTLTAAFAQLFANMCLHNISNLTGRVTQQQHYSNSRVEMDNTALSSELLAPERCGNHERQNTGVCLPTQCHAEDSRHTCSD